MSSNQIEHFLNSWKDGVIEIGRIHLEGGDYEKSAELFVSTHYAFDSEEVLFKPTFTKEVIFRNSKDLALSYFIGGEVAEDKGFALKPWEEIRLEELSIIEQDNLMVAMGTLNFKPLNLEENTLIAFTFLLIDTDDSLKIKVHHSSPI
ncbi:MAG: hypothetical protein CMQ73_03115 [Gammaproteobacteria bacterium]|nr:hypothetical protein [Gammaproteobacteria bacterium]OUT95311.1 MAG: hypothetical protein CBB96_04150 [Gammaproteobacteria bacterium TMED36]|tara:strand:- start:38783 stop:39226 length:444 start_codon:yes stop_codon:yes gene_type:complete